MKDFNRICSGLNNKFSRLNTANTELEAKYTAEIQSLKSKIKTLKREGTLAQKASSADKIKILSLEAKVRELEGKLEDLKPDPIFHDYDVMGGMIEEPAQISSSDPKKIDTLRLELEQVKEDLNSKKYEIECMEKGIEASDNIYKRELDIRSSERLKLMEENISLRDQLALKKEPRDASHNEVDSPLLTMNDSSQLGPEGIPSTLNPSQIISVGGAEVVSLPAIAPIIASSLMSPILIYSIITLVIIVIIWFMVRKWWNLQKKSLHARNPPIDYSNTIFYAPKVPYHKLHHI